MDGVLSSSTVAVVEIALLLLLSSIRLHFWEICVRLFLMSLVDIPMLMYMLLVGLLGPTFSFVTWVRNRTIALFLALSHCVILSTWFWLMRTSERALTIFMIRRLQRLFAKFSKSMLYSLKILEVNLTFHRQPMLSLLGSLMMD